MTGTLELTKHHGLGNDFLVARWQENPDLTPDPDRARAVCARHTGVGADGLIVEVHPDPESALSEARAVTERIAAGKPVMRIMAVRPVSASS